jgi:hypothetical protein
MHETGWVTMTGLETVTRFGRDFTVPRIFSMDAPAVRSNASRVFALLRLVSIDVMAINAFCIDPKSSHFYG